MTWVYVGTRRDSGGGGIVACRMDERGHLAPARTSSEEEAVFFAAVHPNRRYLYAASRVREPGEADGAGGPGATAGEGGYVSAHRIDPVTGALEPLGRQPAHGTVPCYVSVTPDGRYLLSVDYNAGVVAMFPIEADGSLLPACDVHRRQGAGVHPRRQSGPHGHCVLPDAEGRFAFVADLGTDEIAPYRLDLASGRLEAGVVPAVKTNPGAGPRHVAFHPNGRLAYVANEIDSTVTAYRHTPGSGRLDPIGTYSTLPAGVAPENTCADIRVHPNGRFVYVSNRGHDSIAAFAIDPGSGGLTPAGHTPARGAVPWSLALTSDGAFMCVANFRSNAVAVFSVDRESGGLTPVGNPVTVPGATCIAIVSPGA